MFTALLWVIVVSYNWAQTIPLTVQKLEAVNVTMEEVSFKGKKAIRVNPTSADAETIAILKGTTFENGTITLQVAGKTLPSARLYVNDASQPCLIVNDLKFGKSTGAIALWVGQGTDGYFADLSIK